MDPMGHGCKRPLSVRRREPGTFTPQDRFPPIAVIGRCRPHGPVRDIARTGWTTALGAVAELHASSTLRSPPTQTMGPGRLELGARVACCNAPGTLKTFAQRPLSLGKIGITDALALTAASPDYQQENDRRATVGHGERSSTSHAAHRCFLRGPRRPPFFLRVENLLTLYLAAQLVVGRLRQ